MSPARLASLAALALLAAAPAAAQPASLAIDIWSFGFAPQPIRLAAGRPVTLTFVNRSGGGHDFTARSFFASALVTGAPPPGGQVVVPAHQSRSITLVPRAGSYTAFCSHFLHRQFGMRVQIR